VTGVQPSRRVVTFDLFSALLDSRTGGAAAFDRLVLAHGWPLTGVQLYDAWDPLNKAAQRDCVSWVPWREPASRALAEAYRSLGVDGDVAAGIETLVESMSRWPVWPDVAGGLPVLAEHNDVGLLSNVDDEIFERTAAAALVDRELAFTSQRLLAYKPHAAIYRRALAEAASMVHVATSARDVRGALEAGIPVVRLRRPGHTLDPEGPRPTYEVDTVRDLPVALAAVGREQR
jgi:2-haloacid dehalogenase